MLTSPDVRDAGGRPGARCERLAGLAVDCLLPFEECKPVRATRHGETALRTLPADRANGLASDQAIGDLANNQRLLWVDDEAPTRAAVGERGGAVAEGAGPLSGLRPSARIRPIDAVRRETIRSRSFWATSAAKATRISHPS